MKVSTLLKLGIGSAFLAVILIFTSCKVTLISGYDEVIEQTAIKIKNEFNLHFVKLKRTIQDQDSTNQKFENFQDYYDHMETDLFLLEERAKSLGSKSEIVQKQIANLDSIMFDFMNKHKRGFPDRPGDDRRDLRNAVNSSLNAVIKLQEELKTTKKSKPKS